MPSAMTLKGLLCLVALGLCAEPSAPTRRVGGNVLSYPSAVSVRTQSGRSRSWCRSPPAVRVMWWPAS